MHLIRRNLLHPSTVGLGLLALCLLASPGWALDDETRLELTQSKVVDPALIDALASWDRVGARVYYLEPDGFDKHIDFGAEHRDVSPVLVDLVSGFTSGEVALADVDPLWGVKGLVDAEAVRGLMAHPAVLYIAYDASVPLASEVSLKATCSASTTQACVQGNRFGIQVNMSGAATVAASSAQSAVFWRFASSNWEVVGKVLNGCSINNSWWVFGAGATTQSYALSVYDYSSGGSIAYNGAVLCPIADTGQYNSFPCP